MTLRLDVTTETATSETFEPAGEIILQLQAEHPGAVVNIETRLDEVADWQVVDTMGSGRPLCRIASLPIIRLTLKGNRAGEPVKVWSF